MDDIYNEAKKDNTSGAAIGKEIISIVSKEIDTYLKRIMI